MAREVTIRPCEEAYGIARSLIVAHHPHLAEEGDVLISYLTTTAHRTSGGQAVLASTVKASDLVRFFAPLSEKAGRKPDFVVLISDGAWSFADERERKAMIDHCLCCIEAKDGKRGRTFKLVGPDVHEFAAVVQRHGLWHLNLKLLGRATQGRQAQMDLGLVPTGPAVADSEEEMARAAFVVTTIEPEPAQSADGLPYVRTEHEPYAGPFGTSSARSVLPEIQGTRRVESHDSAPERAEPFPDTPDAEERREAALARLESTARTGR